MQGGWSVPTLTSQSERLASCSEICDQSNSHCLWDTPAWARGVVDDPTELRSGRQSLGPFIKLPGWFPPHASTIVVWTREDNVWEAHGPIPNNA